MSWETVKEITDKEFSAGKIANLPNRPNRGAGFGETGLTASQLKAYFDKNVELLKETINNIIDEGDPATLAKKISIFGNEKFSSLSELIAVINDEDGDGGFSDIIRVNVDEEIYDLNSFLQSLQKNKVQSSQGGVNKGKVYIIDENSDDALLGYSEDATPHSIVKRTESGDILVPEGSTNDGAAISRKDVKELLTDTVTQEEFEAEKIRTNAFVKSAKVEYDEANHVIRLTFTDGNGETDTSSVDLPLEMAFVGARLEDGNLVFTLQNGQEVSVPIGDVLGGLITSGALAQALDGNEEDKAPSVKAVNEGLAEKVDKTNTPLRVYGTKGVDANGNTIHGEYKLHYVAIDQGALLQVSLPSNKGFDATTPTQTAAVCDPEKPYQIANKQWSEKSFREIISRTNVLYGTGGTENGKTAQRHYYMSANGTNTGDVVCWNSPTSDTFDKKIPECTIGVCDPVKPYQVVNLRTLDRVKRDLQQGVYNAIGVQYITVEDTSESLIPNVPENAMQFACIESVGNAVACAEDGTEIGSVDVRVTANYAPVDTTNLPVYVDMGDGLLLHYEVDYAPSGTFFVKVTGRKIIYQVKVGA